MAVLNLPRPGLSCIEAATRAGVNNRTILRWIQAGTLDALRVFDAYWIPEDSLQRCLDRRAETASV